MAWCEEKKIRKSTVRRESRFSIPERSSVKYCRRNLEYSILLLWEDTQKGRTVSWIGANFKISQGGLWWGFLGWMWGGHGHYCLRRRSRVGVIISLVLLIFVSVYFFAILALNPTLVAHFQKFFQIFLKF